MVSRAITLAASGVLAAGLGAGALGVASAAAPTPSAPSAPSQTARPKADHPRHPRPLLGRVIHGQGTVKTRQGWETLVVQRGQIVSVSATSLTLRSSDGFTSTYTLNSATKVRARGQAATVGELKPGERAMVLAVKQGNALLAKRVAHLKAAQPAPAKSGA